MDDLRTEKIAFVVSVAVLAWLYGFFTNQKRWFPNNLLLRAWYQTTATASPPHFMHERVYEFSGVRRSGAGEVAGGVTLVSGMWADSATKPGIKLLARDGEVLHRWVIDPVELFPDPPAERSRRDPALSNVHGVHLFPDGDVMFNISYVGTARIGPCGEIRWTLPAGGHHSIVRADDGSFWVSGGSWRRPGENGVYAGDFPGLADSVYHDRVLHVSESGTILDEIDVLGLLYANGLQRHIPKGSRAPAGSSAQGDVTHLNDVEPLPDSLADEYRMFEGGDLALSLHHLDLVMVVDPESGRLRWHASHAFVQQHDVDFLGDGWIGVFDNNRDGTDRGSLAGGSRIVALQPHDDSTVVLFPTPASDPFYTPVEGKWQSLGNGNLLLTESTAGRVVEVTAGGETVWEWAVGAADEGLVPEVTEGTRYDYSRERVSSWECPRGDEIGRGSAETS